MSTELLFSKTVIMICDFGYAKTIVSNILLGILLTKGIEMFRFNCCDAKRKCKTFRLANKNQALLKMGICSKCKRISAIIEIDGIVKVRRSGIEAYELYRKNLPNILYEVKRIESGKNGWYLEYGEYGRKKKCYSNLRTLRLGLVDSITIDRITTTKPVGVKLAG